MIEKVSPHRQRGWLLAQQGRHEMAEREYRLALAEDPQDAETHALLALLLAAQEERRADALQSARTAVALAPDEPFPHFAEAHVHLEADRWRAAEDAAREALRIDPDDPAVFSVLAAAHLGRRQWQEALAAADEGLAIDPYHTGCANIRATALVHLGRRDEAGAVLSGALTRNPEDSHTHANQGWTHLHRGDRRPALEHFREALRLDPGSEWAREGLAEALKARNPLYAAMLRYFLWMHRLPARTRWMVVLGGFLGFRAAKSALDANPSLGWWLEPLLMAYLLFLLMSWTAPQLFNAFLLLSRDGRYALSPEQRLSGRWVGGGYLVSAAFFAAAISGRADWAVPAAVLSAALLIPLAATFSGPRGRPRPGVAAGTAAGYGLASAAVAAGAAGSTSLAGTLFIICLLGVMVSTWLLNATSD